MMDSASDAILFGMSAEEFYAQNGVTSSSEAFVSRRQMRLFTRRWIPANQPPKALIIAAPGYKDNMSWVFQKIMVRFASLGFAVVGLDHEGQGKSDGVKLGIRSHKAVEDDMQQLAEEMKGREDFAHLPCFGYGMSFGGAVVINISRRYPETFKGIILSAPMCKIAATVMPTPFEVFIAKAVCTIAPLARIVTTKDMIDNAIKSPEARVVAKSDPDFFALNPCICIGLQMLGMAGELCAHLEEVEAPFLVLHGEDDRVTEASVSKGLYERARSKDKTLRLYPTGWHSLLFGEEPAVTEKAWEDIKQWLDARLAPPTQME